MSELETLIPQLRMHLGDTDPSSYRYMDEWLLIALQSSIKALQRWWGARYMLDDSGDVIRGTDVEGHEYEYEYEAEQPPVIEQQDERPIILMASILIKSGQLESNSWQVGSWRDAEIAVSNIEGSRSKQFGINLDWQELQYYLRPPSKRLFGADRINPPNEDLWVN